MLLLLLGIASLALALIWLLNTPVGAMDENGTEATRARLGGSLHLAASTFARHDRERNHEAC